MHGKTQSTQSWKVGSVTVTSVVEAETRHIPPEFFFPESSAPEVAEHGWLVPTWAAADGTLILRVQAFVVEVGARRVVVDPCVGNGKARNLPFWHMQQYTFLDDFVAAGFDLGAIDHVVHTHLHADHCGWDTHLVDGEWTPTFPNARHLYTERELDFWRANEQRVNEDVYADSIEPIIAAGLADIVDEDADLGDGLRLSPTTGHTPGHVSMWIDSDGERGVISGDLMHHPVQFARPEWAEIGDWDAGIGRTTRRAFLDEVARDEVLMFGTHFPTEPAGRVTAHDGAYRFSPE